MTTQLRRGRSLERSNVLKSPLTTTDTAGEDLESILDRVNIRIMQSYKWDICHNAE